MNILITDKFHQDALNFLSSQNYKIDYFPEITPTDLSQSIEKYDGLIVRSRTKVTKEVIERGINLKIIARAGSGVDNIDIKFAQKKKIAVINATGSNSQAVAELTIGLILSLYRKICYADRHMHQGDWVKNDIVGWEIYNKTVGILGFGFVGKKVASLVRAFGANVIVCGKNDPLSKFENLLIRSDIICIHVRLNEKTKGFINKEKISLMKKTAIIINVSRGEVIVEEDLYQALKTQKITGAALDVFWQEPLAKDSRWTNLDNVVLTPHIGGQTQEASKKACMMVVVDLVKFFKGEIINSRVV